MVRLYLVIHLLWEIDSTSSHSSRYLLHIFITYKTISFGRKSCQVILVVGKVTGLNEHVKEREKAKTLSCVQLFASQWTAAYQVPPSIGFSRQEQWSGLPFPSPGDLPDPGIEPRSPTLQADTLSSEPPGKNERVPVCYQQKHLYGLKSPSVSHLV